VEFEGVSPADGAAAGAAFDLIGFAEILSRTFPPNRSVAQHAVAGTVAAVLP
jgi:hypothetical protein